tara:strand:+ start:9888 stop:11939 length:2052 start_codon:yes stop_codon:yes gene_type:complete
METYITQITYINDYLNQILSPEERIAFEEKLRSDVNFKALFEEHKILLQGMRRVIIKNEIAKIHNGYLRGKFVKTLGIFFLAIVTITLLFLGFQQWNHSDPADKVPKQQKKSKAIPTQGILVPSNDTNTPNLKTLKDSINFLLENQEEEILMNNETIKSSLSDLALANSTFSPITDVVLEQFYVESSRDTTLICKGGTRLYFPAHAFKSSSSDAQWIDGTVAINIKEYHTLDDILLGNLSTTSNNHILETGGMLHVTAQKGGQQLLLDKPMTITFPTKKTKEDMQLFIGAEKEVIIDWQLAAPISYTLAVEMEEKQEPIADVPFAVVENVPVFANCTGTEAEKKSCTQEAINRHVMRNFDAEICATDIPTGVTRLFARLKIKRDGSVEHIRSQNNSDCIQIEIKRVLESMPLFTPGRQRGLAVDVLYSMPINIQLDDDKTYETAISEEVPKNRVFDTIYSTARTDIEILKEILHDNEIDVTSAMLESYQELRKTKLIRDIKVKGTSYVLVRKSVFEIPTTYFKRLDTDSVSRGGHVYRIPWGADKIPDRKITRLVSRNESVGNYIFNSLQLGWLNCDRFTNANGPKMKFKLKIKNAEGANVKLVFKNMRSILNGNKRANSSFDFGSITKNLPVTLVAIQKGKEGYYMGMKEIRIEEMGTLNLDFKEYTSKELRQTLKKLTGSN